MPKKASNDSSTLPSKQPSAIQIVGFPLSLTGTQYTGILIVTLTTNKNNNFIILNILTSLITLDEKIKSFTV